MDAEQPVVFSCNRCALRGILHRPSRGSTAQGGNTPFGVVFLHGWSGCRLGPHRMFVHAARQLSRAGYPCLRFDFRGRGESEGTTREASIRSMTEDCRAAVDFFAMTAGVAQVVLLSICSGSKVAIAAATEDNRIAGMILWSAEPMGHKLGEGRNRRRFCAAFTIYLRKLFRPETWRKLVRGHVNTQMVQKTLFNAERPNEAEREAEDRLLERFRSYAGPVLFVYGTADPPTRLAVARYQTWLQNAHIPVECRAIEGANHSFYSLRWEREVLDITSAWMTRRFPIEPALSGDRVAPFAG